MYELLIEGPPIALQRHRMARGISYDPQSKVKKDLITKLSPILKHLPCLEEPLHVEMVFVFAYPKSKSKKWKRENYFKSTRSDLDNLVKLPSDVFNGILWKDDALIVSLAATKRYGELSYTMLRWEEI